MTKTSPDPAGAHAPLDGAFDGFARIQGPVPATMPDRFPRLVRGWFAAATGIGGVVARLGGCAALFPVGVACCPLGALSVGPIKNVR